MELRVKRRIHHTRRGPGSGCARELSIKGVLAQIRTRFLRDQLWTALTLEVGKSPTEVPPGRRLPVAEFISSSSLS